MRTTKSNSSSNQVLGRQTAGRSAAISPSRASSGKAVTGGIGQARRSVRPADLLGAIITGKMEHKLRKLAREKLWRLAVGKMQEVNAWFDQIGDFAPRWNRSTMICIGSRVKGYLAIDDVKKEKKVLSYVWDREFLKDSETEALTDSELAQILVDGDALNALRQCVIPESVEAILRRCAGGLRIDHRAKESLMNHGNWGDNAQCRRCLRKLMMDLKKKGRTELRCDDVPIDIRENHLRAEGHLTGGRTAD